MTTFVDLFCGAGGSSTGLVEAGWELLLAANHDKTAISTHAANHPKADHLCADVSQYDMRRLPKARVLWASPICTELSPAGGRKKRRRGPQGQPVIDGFEIPDAALERTRATFWDVLRATEVWRYDAVMCENVVEALDWELFEVWRSGMHLLGYQSQIVSASSAHLGDAENAPAPQWRDRIYIVFVRESMRMPDLAPRPLAHCERCGDVEAVQSWRNGRRWGKYRQQYDYRCPECKWIVEPYLRPAASIIDWSDLGTRIGDRPRPLAAATMSRIERGLAVDLFVVTLRGGAKPTSVNDPLGAVCASGNRHSLVVPGGDPFVVTLRRNGTASSVANPITGISAGGNHHGLVVPYRKGTAKPTSEPMLTLGTRDSAAIVRPAASVHDCHFRMIQPREQLAAQRFPTDYIVHGNKGEQTMQAGNAVSVNAAHWIGRRVAAVL